MLSFLGNHWVLDFLDVSIVTVIFYKLYMFIRSTRAVSMFLGLLLLIGGGLVAEILGLHGLSWIMSSLKTIWLIGFLVVFQPELRRALSVLGQNPILRPFVSRHESNEAIDVIVSGILRLAEHRSGALVVILGHAGMKGVIETGTPLYARTSEELLLTIFTPKSPLHDGAIVIQGDQILAAGCILPLTQNPQLSKTLGTRHRAAIGITEEADCLVIVVSEESGIISSAKNGKLTRAHTRESLRAVLAAAFEETSRQAA